MLKRKAVLDESVPKRWKNQLAYYHWRNQIQVCEARLAKELDSENQLDLQIVDLDVKLYEDIRD